MSDFKRKRAQEKSASSPEKISSTTNEHSLNQDLHMITSPTKSKSQILSKRGSVKL